MIPRAKYKIENVERLIERVCDRVSATRLKK